MTSIPAPPAPLAVPARAAFARRWLVPALAAAAVVALAGDGLPVWTSGDVTATELPWPAGIERRSGAYLWRVSGLRDGATVAESRMTAFRIP